jgi:hypothetical protein
LTPANGETLPSAYFLFRDDTAEEDRMRLLRIRDMNFVDFFRPDIPEYAILSHRWREDEAMLADV